MPKRGGGEKRTKSPIVSFGVTLPEGVYEELVAVIETGRRWQDRVEFTREAIKEKLDRWKKEHPLWSPPAKDRPKW